MTMYTKISYTISQMRSSLTIRRTVSIVIKTQQLSLQTTIKYQSITYKIWSKQQSILTLTTMKTRTWTTTSISIFKSEIWVESLSFIRERLQVFRVSFQKFRLQTYKYILGVLKSSQVTSRWWITILLQTEYKKTIKSWKCSC